MAKKENKTSAKNAQVDAKNAHTELIGNSEQFKFTKGDWVAEKKSETQICHLIKTGEKYTVHVYDSKYGIDEDESWANAVLISKAPDLLKMLISILRHIKNEELEEISHFPMLKDAYILLRQVSVQKYNEYRCDICKDSGAVKTGEYEYSDCPCVSDDRS